MDSAVRVTLRLPAELHACLTTRANQDRRSLNAEIVYLLERAISNDSK